jgi:hypothetical protein
MRIDGTPTEEILRALLDEARAAGAAEVRVQTGHDLGDAWIRAGFSEETRVLSAPVDAIERLLSATKGLSYGAVHVQTDDIEAVVRAVRSFVPRLPGGSRGSVVVPPRNGWTAVHDELGDRDPEMLRRLARELSDRMGAVVLLLGVEDDAIVRFVFLERGRVMDEYLSVPEYHGPLPPGDVVGLGANPTVVARLTGADPRAVRAVARTAPSVTELPPARELVEEIAAAIGIEGAGLGYEEARALPDAVEVPRA